MKTLGNVVFIQRGETWSLDFDVTNKRGDPYMLFREWRNPYLAITVTAARYEQKGDFRTTWWLDMNQRWIEQENGSFALVPMKRFTETEPLYTPFHSISQVLDSYSKITATGDKENPFDVTNYLFFTDNNADGSNSYKYLSDYTRTAVYQQIFRVTVELNTANTWITEHYYGNGEKVIYNDNLYVCVGDHDSTTFEDEADYWFNLTSYLGQTVSNLYDEGETYEVGDIYMKDDKCYVYCEDITISALLEVELFGEFENIGEPLEYVYEEVWEEYNFRIIKQFNTKDWVEQNYLFDVKILAGESVKEHIKGILVELEIDTPELPWTDEDTNNYIKLIPDKQLRKQMQEYQDSGAPLMPDFDTKSLVLEPTKLVVSANIQGGFR